MYYLLYSKRSSIELGDGGTRNCKGYSTFASGMRNRDILEISYLCARVTGILHNASRIDVAGCLDCVESKLVMRGDQVLITSALRQQLLVQVHEGHVGHLHPLCNKIEDGEELLARGAALYQKTAFLLDDST